MFTMRIRGTSCYFFLLLFEFISEARAQIDGFSERIGCIESVAGTTCYDAVSAAVNWTEAWSRCPGPNGRLATPTTPEVNGLIGDYLDRIAANMVSDLPVWIGGRELNSSSWQWLGGQRFQYDVAVDSEPEVNSTSSSSSSSSSSFSSSMTPLEACAVVSTNGSSSSSSSSPSSIFFQGLRCSAGVELFVCQRRDNWTVQSITCRLGPYAGVVHGDSCYAIFGLSSANPVTWFQARYECIKYGADLAVFNESRDHDVIASILMTRNGKAFWIGLRRYPWMWQTRYSTDNQEVDQWQEMTYTQWNISSPSHKGLSCLSMNGRSGTIHGWVNRQCSESHAYICQQTSIATTTVPSTTIPSTIGIQIIYIDVNLTDSSSDYNAYRDKIAHIVVPCAIVAVIMIIIGFTIYVYFHKRQRAYSHP